VTARPAAPERRSQVVLLAALAAVACLLVTGWDLGLHSLWVDEAFTVHDARRSVADILAQRGEAYGGAHHPPLYFLVVKGAMALCGTSEACVRAPSVLADAGIAAVLVVIAARLFGRAAAVAAAVSWPTLPYALKYAQQARHYPLFALFALVALLLAVRVLALDGRGRASDRACAALGLFVGLTLATHLFAVPWTFALALWGFGWWLAQRRVEAASLPRAREWLVAAMGLAIGLLPIVPGLGRMFAGVGAGELASKAGPVENWRELVVDVTTAALDTPIVPALAAVAIVLGPRRVLVASLAMLALAPLVAVLLRNPEHFVPLRYFMPSVGVTVLVTAAGLAALWHAPALLLGPGRTRIATAVGLALAVAFAIPLARLHAAGVRKHFGLETFEPWRDVAGWLSAQSQAGDAVMPMPPDIAAVPFEVYDPAMPVLDPNAELADVTRVFLVSSHVEGERVQLRRTAIARLRANGFTIGRVPDQPRSKTIEITVFVRR
jgi:4-amino-4-deoxy-L-arabinose transferase-like glycosyltransferase